jgi:hypothetical protein
VARSNRHRQPLIPVKLSVEWRTSRPPNAWSLAAAASNNLQLASAASQLLPSAAASYNYLVRCAAHPRAGSGGSWRDNFPVSVAPHPVMPCGRTGASRPLRGADRWCESHQRAMTSISPGARSSRPSGSTPSPFSLSSDLTRLQLSCGAAARRYDRLTVVIAPATAPYGLGSAASSNCPLDARPNPKLRTAMPTLPPRTPGGSPGETSDALGSRDASGSGRAGTSRAPGHPCPTGGW